MQSVLDFLSTYWTYISAGIIILIEVLIVILKKRPITLDVFLDAVRQCVCNLPKMISYVEGPGHGDEKKEQVILYGLAYVSDLLHRDLTVSESKYVEATISEQIEKILSTPQKKGAQNA